MFKLNRKKKSQSIMSPLQGLLLFLAVTIVFLVFYLLVIPYFRDEVSDKELCRLSVMGKYGGKTATLGTSESNIALQCFTQTINVNKDGVYQIGKDAKPRQIELFPSYSFSGGKSKADINNERIELVKQAVADKMYDCWDQFWQGKLAIWTGGEKRCVICSDISFDSDWIDVSGLENLPGEAAKKDAISNFGEYLNTQKINKEQTYADFFGGKFENDFSINPRVNTKIVFKSIGRSWLEAHALSILTGEVFGCGVGLYAGLAVGVAIAATGFIGWIAGGAALTIAGAGCSVGIVSGGVVAASQGGEWAPAMVVGPSALVAESCDRLY